MARSSFAMPPPRHRWLLVALACAALLVIPALGLLLVPAPRPSSVPPPRAATPIAATSHDEAPTPDASARVVTGVVRDDSDTPIGGAKLRVEGEAVQTSTDAEGSFALVGLSANAASVVATREGFLTAKVSLPPPDGAEQRVDIRLSRATPIVGVVLDADGKPTPKAFVGCEDQQGLAGATDGEGRFTLPAEAAGCTAIATHANYGPSDSVRLQAGRDNTLRLGRGGGISGLVLDEKGAAVHPYLLAIESFLPAGDPDTPGQNGVMRSVDDPAGAFLLEGLIAGRYVLTVSAAGRPPTRSNSIEVEAGRTTHHVRIVLAAGATLVGVIQDAESRQPVAGATVALDALTSTGANAIMPATTDAAGEFSLAGVPPGPFSVRVVHPSYRTKIVSGLTTRGASTLRESIALTLRGDGGGDSELAGIGAMLGPSPNGVIVAGIIADGPAARAGLLRGDRIERIDGAAADTLTVSDCVQRLRGPEGTTVSIRVARAQGSTDITIVRGVVVR